MSAPFTMKPLPYADDALSPVINAGTIGFHYGKHHTTYLNNLNNLLANDPLKDKSLAEVVKAVAGKPDKARSEEHTSELQSLMRNSYAVFCLKKKKTITQKTIILYKS